jgi:hypothetical protein
VICAGDQPKDKELCEALGAVWVNSENKPLAKKWNSAFQKAREYNPDSCLYVGSSDFIEDGWIYKMRPHLELHGFVGVKGMYLTDVSETIRLCHWPGYEGTRRIKDRDRETIGIGRMLSGDLLDKLNWLPFLPTLDNSLDKSMKDRAECFGYTDVMIPDLKAVSISSDVWPQSEQNKHKFSHHYDETDPHYLPSQKLDPEPFISTHFPEINTLCESLKATYQNQ